MCLSKWLGDHHDNGHFESPTELALPEKEIGGSLKGLESEDPEALTVGNQPIVVPIHEDLLALNERAEIDWFVTGPIDTADDQTWMLRSSSSMSVLT